MTPIADGPRSIPSPSSELVGLPGEEGDRILHQPEATLASYCRQYSHMHPELMDLRYVTELRIALMIERDRRIFLGATGNALLALSKEEISTALIQVMRNSGLHAVAEKWYDALWLWAMRDGAGGTSAGAISFSSADAEPRQISSPPEDTSQ